MKKKTINIFVAFGLVTAAAFAQTPPPAKPVAKPVAEPVVEPVVKRMPVWLLWLV